MAGGAGKRHGFGLGGLFDIAREAPDPTPAGRVLLPILGEQCGVALERGKLTLAFDAARGYFTLNCCEHCLPVDPAGCGALLRRALQTLRGGSLAPRGVLQMVAEEMDRLPPHHTQEPAQRQRRQRDKTRLKARLANCVQNQPRLLQAIEQMVAELNGRPGERSSFDRLDTLIAAQPYRLAYWRTAADEINYRRFFDINELAALRMDRPEVFEATHRLILELAASGAIDGVRLDHPDGLADPAGCFGQLQRRYAEVSGLSPRQDQASAPEMPLFAVAEKIVAAHEKVPADWALHGTTGCRFANVINGVLVDGASKSRLDRAWRVFAPGEAEDCCTLSWHCRHVVMGGALAGQLTVVQHPAAAGACRPAHARLHAQFAARCAGRGGGLVPGLPHLHRRPARPPGSQVHRLGHRPRTPAQPCGRRQRLRLPAPRAAGPAAGGGTR